MGIEEFLNFKDVHLFFIETFVDNDDDYGRSHHGFDNGDAKATDNHDGPDQAVAKTSDENREFEDDILNIYDFDEESSEDEFFSAADNQGENDEVTRAFQSPPEAVRRGDSRLNPLSPAFVPRATNFVPRSVHNNKRARPRRHEENLQRDVPEERNPNPKDVWDATLSHSKVTEARSETKNEGYYWELPEVVAREEAALGSNHRQSSPEEKQLKQKSRRRKGSPESRRKPHPGDGNIEKYREKHSREFPEVIAREETCLGTIGSVKLGSNIFSADESLIERDTQRNCNPRTVQDQSPNLQENSEEKENPDDEVDDDNDEVFRLRNLRRRRRFRGTVVPHNESALSDYPARDPFRPINSEQKSSSRPNTKPFFHPDDPFQLDTRGASAGGSKKPTNQLTLYKKKGIKFFSTVDLERLEKQARQRAKIDENVDEGFELFKQIADLDYETESVNDKFSITKFLGEQ